MPDRPFNSDTLLQIIFMVGLFTLAFAEGMRKQRWSTFLGMLVVGFGCVDGAAITWPHIGGPPGDFIRADPVRLEHFLALQRIHILFACLYAALPWLAAWFCGRRAYLEYLAAKRALIDNHSLN